MPMAADSTKITKGINKGKIQNYYACENKDCPGRDEIGSKYPGKRRNSIRAQDLDEGIKNHIRKTVLSNPSYIKQIVDFTNKELMSSLPDKKQIMWATKRKLGELKAVKDGIFKAISKTQKESTAFHRYLTDLEENARQLSETEKLLGEQEREIKELSRDLITEDFLKRSLEILINCETVFEPDKQKALIQAVIGEVNVGLDEIEIRLNAGSLHRLARDASNPNKLVKRVGGGGGATRFGPLLDGFECIPAWHARRDSNPKPSGP